MPTPQDVMLTTSQVAEMPDTMRKMPSHRNIRFPIGSRCLQDHTASLPGPSDPAYRATQSSGRTVLITGPSSSTTEVNKPVERTTSPWTFTVAYTAMLCKTMSLAPWKTVFIKTMSLAPCQTVFFKPFQDHPVHQQCIFEHFKTIQSLNLWMNYPNTFLLVSVTNISWWSIWQKQTFKGSNPCPST